jgi:hypothetical protein
LALSSRSLLLLLYLLGSSLGYTNDMKRLITLLFLNVTLALAENPFASGQEWRLMIGHPTWYLTLTEEANGVWLSDAFQNESEESYVITLAPLTPEEQEALELKADYWVFSVSRYGMAEIASRRVYQCVLDLAKAQYSDAGEILSIDGERFDYTVTESGLQLEERGQICWALRPEFVETWK